MPENLIDPNPHIQRLVNEGYKVTIDGQFLIIDNVPYISSANVISRAELISSYNVVGDVAVVGGDHTVWFTGSVPCMADGTSLSHVLVADEAKDTIAGRQVQCRLSNKPDPIGNMLDNHYNKIIHYIRKLTAFAQVVDPNTTASQNGSLCTRIQPSVFHYPNTAIARSGLDAYETKLKLKRVTIIGLGGTGAYILDALAKTEVSEIHLYDGDVIETHNAYRIPGALNIEEACSEAFKTDYLQQLYARMRIGVFSHPQKVDSSNLHELDDCDFVFIAVDHGPSRGLIANYLVSKEIPFIDVGIGVDKITETTELHARARVTLVTSETSNLVATLPVADDTDDAVYNNIQLIELNAINAMLAIVSYKQYLKFYTDEEHANVIKYKCSQSRIILD